MKDFPSITPDTEADRIRLLRFIVKERPNDVRDFNNLKDVFMSGRKVGKVPSSSLDVSPSDRVGDFNYDTSYLYLVVLSGADAEWRRVALGTW